MAAGWRHQGLHIAHGKTKYSRLWLNSGQVPGLKTGAWAGVTEEAGEADGCCI